MSIGHTGTIVGYEGSVDLGNDIGLSVISWAMALNGNINNIKNVCDPWVSWHPGALSAQGAITGFYNINISPISDTIMLGPDDSPSSFDVTGQDVRMILIVDPSVRYTFQATITACHINRDNRICPVTLEWVSNGPIIQDQPGDSIDDDDDDDDDDPDSGEDPDEGDDDEALNKLVRRQQMSNDNDKAFSCAVGSCIIRVVADKTYSWNPLTLTQVGTLINRFKAQKVAEGPNHSQRSQT